MIKQIIALSLVSLSVQTTGDGNEEAWSGQTNSKTSSVSVIGTAAKNAITKIAHHKQLTGNDIARQRLINKYGLEKVQALENGTLGNIELLPLFNSPGTSGTPESSLVTIQEVANLGIAGGSVSMQPSRGWAYVNKPLYLQSDTRPITKTTTILGNTVTITATPASYTWHCGDGHSFTTKDRGGTWPHGTVTYSYTHPGTYTLNAEIVWRASYTVNGRTYPVDGTLTTTSTSQEIKIVEAEAVLTR